MKRILCVGKRMVRVNGNGTRSVTIGRKEVVAGTVQHYHGTITRSRETQGQL